MSGRGTRKGGVLGLVGVGRCSRHRAELLENRRAGERAGVGWVCGGGRCRVEGAGVALCERHHAGLVGGGAR